VTRVVKSESRFGYTSQQATYCRSSTVAESDLERVLELLFQRATGLTCNRKQSLHTSSKFSVMCQDNTEEYTNINTAQDYDEIKFMPTDTFVITVNGKNASQ